MYALTRQKMFDRALGVIMWSHRIVALRCLGDGSHGGIVQMTREFGTYWPRAMTTVTHRHRCCKHKNKNTARILRQTVIYFTKQLLELTRLKVKFLSFHKRQNSMKSSRPTAASKREGSPTFQGRNKFLKRRNTFTS
jgi:hypothetical protein